MDWEKKALEDLLKICIEVGKERFDLLVALGELRIEVDIEDPVFQTLQSMMPKFDVLSENIEFVEENCIGKDGKISKDDQDWQDFMSLIMKKFKKRYNKGGLKVMNWEKRAIDEIIKLLIEHTHETSQLYDRLSKLEIEINLEGSANLILHRLCPDIPYLSEGIEVVENECFVNDNKIDIHSEKWKDFISLIREYLEKRYSKK
ncbi:hypothetical protein [Macrococcus carouselicus]|uniref:Uncharacterized protein n=1 Tax=Macrococcus carouselicus TaxID=69969 RepID=A0A9Q8CJ71_9STAP|nr:hypothetical protein [Macrococcus carouselicus]TDL95551.1 hypothetical protein ERX40_10230 [Macrococcus carouselicus]